MASIPVDHLSASDLGALIALEQSAFSPADQQSPRSLRHLLRQANADVLGFRRDGQLLAAASVLYRRGSRIARLYSIATLAVERKSGLAARLLACAEASAQAKGCAQMRAEVREENQASRRLFEQAGYRVTGRRLGYYSGGADAICYMKPLNSHRHD